MIAINGTLDEKTASAIAERFVEVVIALDADDAALAALEDKSNVRVLTAPLPSNQDPDYRRVEGGLLTQDRDQEGDGSWEVVSDRHPTDDETDALRFA